VDLFGQGDAEFSQLCFRFDVRRHTRHHVIAARCRGLSNQRKAWRGMSLLFYLTVGLVYGFLLLPVVMTAWSSVATSPILTFPPRGFTFDWYQAIPGEFMTALKVSLEVGCVTTALATLVGVPAALAIARGRFPGRGLINLFCLSPLMVPTLVIGVASFQFWIRSTDVLGVNL